MVWWIALIVVCSVAVRAGFTRGPRYAVGVACALSVLCPAWVTVQVFGGEVDLRLGIAAAVLLFYLFHPASTYRTRLSGVDASVLLLFAVAVVSDSIQDGFSFSVVVRAYGEWMIAYLAGRVAIQSHEDLRALLPVVTIVASVLALSSLVESGTGFDVFQTVFGARPADRLTYTPARWGLNRAYGPARHCIYFGILQLLLMGWTLYAAACAKRNSGPQWWRATPVLSGLGILGTVSRGPMLGLAVALYSLAFFQMKQWRAGLITVGCVGILVAAFSFDHLLSIAEASGQHNYAKTGNELVIDGESVRQNATTNRINLLKFYRPAMVRAGLFGFGTEATSGFPINVPVGPQDAETLRRMIYVDNTYVLLILRFGWVGLVVFLAFLVSSLLGCTRLASRPNGRGNYFFAAQASAIIGVCVVCLTVWLPRDFAFWMIFSSGAVAGRAGGSALRRGSGIGNSSD